MFTMAVRAVLRDCPDPSKISFAGLLGHTRERYKEAGGDPARVNQGNVRRAWEHVGEHCGPQALWTHAKIRAMMNALKANPRNAGAGRVGVSHAYKGGRKKSARTTRTQSAVPNQANMPRLAPADRIEPAPAQVNKDAYTIEQIEQASLFLSLFGGDADYAARLLRVIGGK